MFLYTLWYISSTENVSFFWSPSLQVLVYLQLYKNISLVFLDGWQEVTNHVCTVTKALSKRPFKYADTLVIDTLTNEEHLPDLSSYIIIYTSIT